MPTERQQDQAWVESQRAEYERRANLSPLKRDIEWFQRFIADFILWRREQSERLDAMCDPGSIVRPDGSVPSISREPLSYWINASEPGQCKRPFGIGVRKSGRHLLSLNMADKPWPWFYPAGRL